MSQQRRSFIKQSAAAAISVAGVPAVRTCLCGVPMRRRRRGEDRFIPLTDCASVVMAAVNKFDEKYGIRIVPSKEASWAPCATSSSTANSTRARALRLVYACIWHRRPKKDMPC